MENRLKERLTGGAILVAIIVALVPEMFKGQDGSAPATGSSSSGDGPPVRTVIVDLSNNPKSSGPLQPASEAPAPVAPTIATTPAQVSPAPVPVPAPLATSPASTPAATVHTSSAAAPRIARAPAPSSNPAAPAAHAAPAGNWSVQLGLFSKRENAERMLSDAKAKGVNAAISGPDAKGQFHVHVTGLTDRSAAAAMAQKMKGEGLPAAIVAP
jgi:cell division septation protein DedD